MLGGGPGNRANHDVAAKFPPNEDHYVVFGHGQDGTLKVGDREVSPAELAELITSDDNYHGQPVTLIACDTGSDASGYANRLAQAMPPGTQVTAPSTTAWTTPDGQAFVAPTTFGPDGRPQPGRPGPNDAWKTFTNGSPAVTQHGPDLAQATGPRTDPANDPANDPVSWGGDQTRGPSGSRPLVRQRSTDSSGDDRGRKKSRVDPDGDVVMANSSTSTPAPTLVNHTTTWQEAHQAVAADLANDPTDDEHTKAVMVAAMTFKSRNASYVPLDLQSASPRQVSPLDIRNADYYFRSQQTHPSLSAASRTKGDGGPKPDQITDPALADQLNLRGNPRAVSGTGPQRGGAGLRPSNTDLLHQVITRDGFQQDGNPVKTPGLPLPSDGRTPAQRIDSLVNTDLVNLMLATPVHPAPPPGSDPLNYIDQRMQRSRDVSSHLADAFAQRPLQNIEVAGNGQNPNLTVYLKGVDDATFSTDHTDRAGKLDKDRVVEWAQVYLAGLTSSMAAATGVPLPLHIRQSFGSLDSTVANTAESIRLSPGSEPPEFHAIVEAAIRRLDNELPGLISAIESQVDTGHALVQNGSWNPISGDKKYAGWTQAVQLTSGQPGPSGNSLVDFAHWVTSTKADALGTQNDRPFLGDERSQTLDAMRTAAKNALDAAPGTYPDQAALTNLTTAVHQLATGPLPIGVDLDNAIAFTNNLLTAYQGQVGPDGGRFPETTSFALDQIESAVDSARQAANTLQGPVTPTQRAEAHTALRNATEDLQDAAVLLAAAVDAHAGRNPAAEAQTLVRDLLGGNTPATVHFTASGMQAISAALLTAQTAHVNVDTDPDAYFETHSHTQNAFKNRDPDAGTARVSDRAPLRTNLSQNPPNAAANPSDHDVRIVDVTAGHDPLDPNVLRQVAAETRPGQRSLVVASLVKYYQLGTDHSAQGMIVDLDPRGGQAPPTPTMVPNVRQLMSMLTDLRSSNMVNFDPAIRPQLGPIQDFLFAPTANLTPQQEFQSLQHLLTTLGVPPAQVNSLTNGPTFDADAYFHLLQTALNNAADFDATSAVQNARNNVQQQFPDQNLRAVPTDRAVETASWSGTPNDANASGATPTPQPVRSGISLLPASDTVNNRHAQSFADHGDAYHVFAHGRPDALTVNGEPVTAQQLAEMIQQDPNWQNRPVVLVSCDTGADPVTGFAAQLAQALPGTRVIAPSGTAWTTADGHATVAATTFDADGRPRPAAPTEHDQWQQFLVEPQPGNQTPQVTPLGSDLATALGRPEPAGPDHNQEATPWSRPPPPTAPPPPPPAVRRKPVPGTPTPQQLGLYHSNPELMYEVDNAYDPDALATGIRNAAVGQVRARLGTAQARLTPGGRDGVRVDTTVIEDALRNDLQSFFTTGGRTFEVAASRYGVTTWHSVTVTPSRPAPSPDGTRHRETWIDQGADKAKYDTRTDTSTAVRTNQGAIDSITVGLGGTGGPRIGPGGGGAFDVSLARGGGSVETGTTTFDSHNVRSGDISHLVRSHVTFDVVAHRPGTAKPTWKTPAPVRSDVGFRVVQDIAAATPSALIGRSQGEFDVALLAENMSAVRIENATTSDGLTRPWNDAAQRILGKLAKTGVLVPGSGSAAQIRGLFNESAMLGMLAPALESSAHSPLVVSPSRRQALGLDVSAKVTAIEPVADIGKSTFRWQPGITETARAQQESSVGGGVAVTPIRWGFGIGFIQARLAAAFRRTTTATAQQSSTTRLGTEHKDVPNSLARVTIKVTVDPTVRLNALRHPMGRTSRPIEVEMTVLARMPQNKLAEVLRPPGAAGPAPAPAPPTGTPAPPFVKYGGRTVPLGMSRFAPVVRNTTGLIRDIGGGFLPKGSRGGVSARMMRSASAVERDHNQAELDRVLSVNAMRQNYHTLLNGGTTAVLRRSGLTGDRYVVVHVTADHDPNNLPVHTGTETKVAARTFQGSGTSDGTVARAQWRGAVALEGGAINRLPSTDVSTSLTPMAGVEVQGRLDRQGGVDITGQSTALHGGTPDSERYEGPLNVRVEVYSYHVGTGRDRRSHIGFGQRVKQVGRTATGFTRVAGGQQVDGRPVDHYETTATEPVTLLYSRSAVPSAATPAVDPTVAQTAPPAFGKDLTNVRNMRAYVDASTAGEPGQAVTVGQWESVESMPAGAHIQQMARQVAADTQAYQDGSTSRRDLGGLRGDSALQRGMPLWARVGNRFSAGRQTTSLSTMTEGQWTLDPLTTPADGGALNLAVAARITNPRLVDARAEIATEHAPGGGAAVSGNRSREWLVQARANLTLGLRKARPAATAGGAGSGGVGYQRLLRSVLVGKRSRVSGFVERNSNNRKGTHRSYLVVADMRVSVGAQVDNKASLPKSVLPSQMQPKSWQRHKSAQRSGLIRNAVYLRVSEEQARQMGVLPNPVAPAVPRPVATNTAQDVQQRAVQPAPGRSPGQGLQSLRDVPSLINPAATALTNAVDAAPAGSQTRKLLQPVLSAMQGAGGLPDPMLNRRHLENMLSRDGVQRSWGALFDGGVSLIHAETDLVSQRLYDVRLEATLPTPEQFEQFVADNEDIDVRTVGTTSSGEQLRTAQGGQLTVGGTGAAIIDPDGKRVTLGGGHAKSLNSQTSTATNTEVEHRTVDVTSGRGVKARMTLQPQFQIKVYHRGRAVPDGTVTFTAPVTVDRWAGDLRLGTSQTPAPLTGLGAYQPTAGPGPDPGWQRPGGLLVPPRMTPEGFAGAKDIQTAVSTLLTDASKRLATAGYPGANQIRAGLAPEVLLANTPTLIADDGLALPTVPATDALLHEAQLTVHLRPLAARLAGIDSKVFHEHSLQTVTSAGTVVSGQQWSSSTPRFQLGQGYVGEPSQALDTSGGGPTTGDNSSKGLGEQGGSAGSAITKPESASALVEYVVRPEVVAKLSSLFSTHAPIVTSDDGTTAKVLVRMSLADARRVLGIGNGAPLEATIRFDAIVQNEQNLDGAATAFTAAAEAVAKARYANPGAPVPQHLIDAQDQAEAQWWSHAVDHYQGLDDFQHSFVAVGNTPNLARYQPPSSTPPAPALPPAAPTRPMRNRPAASPPARTRRNRLVPSVNPGRPLPDLAAARAATPPRTANSTAFDVIDRSTGQSRPVPDAVLRSYREMGLTPPPGSRPAIDLTHVRGVIAYDHRVLNTDGALGPKPIQDFTVKIHLAPQDAAAATQVERVQRQARAAVEQTWNRGLNIGPGHRLNVNVEFTDDPADAHTTVKLFGAEPPGTTQTEWPTTIRPIEIAHEVGHYLGLPDEYHETGPDARVLLSNPGNSGVRHDNGLMELSDSDNQTGVRQRHLDKINEVARSALPPDGRPTAGGRPNDRPDGGLGTRPTTMPSLRPRFGRPRGSTFQGRLKSWVQERKFLRPGTSAPPVDSAVQRAPITVAGSATVAAERSTLANPDLATLRDTYGMPKTSVKRFQRFANRTRLAVYVRPTNPASVGWMGDLAGPKPQSVKAKTINELDVRLGANPDAVGLVGLMRPPGVTPPSGLDDTPVLRVPDASDGADRALLQSRYDQRAAEFDRLAPKYSGQITGSPQPPIGVHHGILGLRGSDGKFAPVTGDHDVFDVRKISRSSAGPLVEHEIDATSYQNVVDRMVAADMSVMHGAHMRWNRDDPNTAAVFTDPADQAMFDKIVGSHRAGGEPLIRFAPNQPVQLVWAPPADTPATGTRAAPRRLIRRRSAESSDADAGRGRKKSRVDTDGDVAMTDAPTSAASPPAAKLAEHTTTWQQAYTAVAEDLDGDPIDDDRTKAVMVAALTYKSRNASYLPLDLQSPTPRQVSPYDIRHVDYYFRSQDTHPSLTAANRVGPDNGADEVTEENLADALRERGNPKLFENEQRKGPQRGGAGLRPSNTDLLTRRITRDGFQRRGNPVGSPDGNLLPATGREPAARVSALLDTDLANLMAMTPAHPAPPPGADPPNYIDQRMQRSRDVSRTLRDAFAARPVDHLEVHDNDANPNLSIYLKTVDQATFDAPGVKGPDTFKKDQLIEWAQVYLAGLTSTMAAAAGIGLPMQIRQSFGSLDSTLANTAESIRLSPGSEPPEFTAVVEAAIRRLNDELPALIALMRSQIGTDSPLLQNGKWKPNSGDKKYAGWATAVRLTSGPATGGNSLIDFAGWVTSNSAAELGSQSATTAKTMLGDRRTETLDALRSQARAALDSARRTYPDQAALGRLTTAVDALAAAGEPLPIGVDLDNAIAFTGNLLDAYRGQVGPDRARFAETTNFALDQIEAAVRSATAAAATLHGPATATQRAQAHTALRNAAEDLQDAAVLLAAAVDAHAGRDPAAEAQALLRTQLGGDSRATVHFTASGMQAISAALLTAQTRHVKVDADPDAYFEVHSHTRFAFNAKKDGQRARVSDRAPLRTKFPSNTAAAGSGGPSHPLRVVDVTTASDPLNPDTLRQVVDETAAGRRTVVVASLVKYYQLGMDHSAQGVVVDLDPQPGRTPPAPTMVPNVQQLLSMLTDLRSSNLVNFDPAIRDALAPIRHFLFEPSADRSSEQDLGDLLTRLGVPPAQVAALIGDNTLDGVAYFDALETALSTTAARVGTRFDAAGAVGRARAGVVGRLARRVPAGLALLPPSDTANNEHAENFADHAGAYRVFAHGTRNALTVDDHPITPGQLADLIRRDPNWRGRPVVLVSCYTGADPDNGFAVQLARALPGTSVIAPSGTAWTTPDGTATVAGTTFDAEGRPRPAPPAENDQWREFRVEPPATAPRVIGHGSTLGSGIVTGRADAVAWAPRRPASSSPERPGAKRAHLDADLDIEMVDATPDDTPPPRTLVDHTLTWQQGHAAVVADLTADRPATPAQTKAVMVAALTYKSHNASYVPLDLQSAHPRQVSPYDIRVPDKYFRSQDQSPALAAARQTRASDDQRLPGHIGEPAIEAPLTGRGNPHVGTGTGPVRGGAGLRPSNTDLLTRTVDRAGFVASGNPRPDASPAPDPATRPPAAERARELRADLLDLIQQTPAHPTDATGQTYLDQRVRRSRETSDALVGRLGDGLRHLEVAGNGRNPNVTIHLTSLADAEFRRPSGKNARRPEKGRVVEWVQVYLAGLTSSMAAAAGIPLPMQIRQSFGSLDSTMADTGPSIRYSPGSEPPEFTAVVAAAIRRLDAELPALITALTQSPPNARVLKNGNWNTVSGDKKYAGWAQAAALTSGALGTDGNSLLGFVQWVTGNETDDVLGRQDDDRPLADDRTEGLNAFRERARAALNEAADTYPDQGALRRLREEVDGLAAGPLPITVDLDNAIAFTDNLLATYAGHLDRSAFPATTHFALDQIEGAVRRAEAASDELARPTSPTRRAELHTVLRNATEDLPDAAVLLAAAVDAHDDRDPAGEAQALVRTLLGGDSRATVHFTASGMQAITSALLTAGTGAVEVLTDPDAYFEAQSHTRQAFAHPGGPSRAARISDRAPLHTDPAHRGSEGDRGSDEPLRVIDVTAAGDPLDGGLLREVAAQSRPGQRVAVVASLVKYYQLGADHSAQGIVVDLDPDPAAPAPAPTMVPNVRQLMSMLTDLRTSNAQHFDPAVQPYLPAVSRFLFTPVGDSDEAYTGALLDLLHGLGVPRNEVAALIGTSPAGTPSFDAQRFFALLSERLDAATPDYTGTDVADDADVVTAHDAAQAALQRLSLTGAVPLSGRPARWSGTANPAGRTPIPRRVDAGLSLLGSADHANHQHAQAYPGDPGAYHVFAHGTPDALTVDDEPVTPRQLAELIRQDPNWRNRPVVLISCDTGTNPTTGFAAQLAQALPGTRVIAPNGTAWTTPDGPAIVAATSYDADGRPRPAPPADHDQWREFLVEPPATRPRVTPLGATLGRVTATGLDTAVSWSGRPSAVVSSTARAARQVFRALALVNSAIRSRDRVRAIAYAIGSATLAAGDPWRRAKLAELAREAEEAVRKAGRNLTTAARTSDDVHDLAAGGPDTWLLDHLTGFNDSAEPGVRSEVKWLDDLSADLENRLRQLTPPGVPFDLETARESE